MNSSLPTFRDPTAIEKLFNRTLGFLVGFGLGPSHIHLLEVRGRKSGKLFSTPVDLLELQGRRYLVARVAERNGSAMPKPPERLR
jgi:hypothetical protein